MNTNTILQELYEVVMDRIRNPRDDSYVCALIGGDKGVDSALEKIGEEAVETIIASKNQDRDAIVEESADLIFHLIVALAAQDIPLEDVLDELRRRRG